ncbi:hypothetical protein C818_04205 [Lachnospiraceae bacterium MD308]|nr:hypothetical protein C818_04205 [Lachnospiraceae bacterium MD308]
MYGYIGGVSDTDEINFCPYCGEEIVIMHAGGTATCNSCKRRFGVVEMDEEGMSEPLQVVCGPGKRRKYKALQDMEGACACGYR